MAHYFSSDGLDQLEPHDIDLQLAGRQVCLASAAGVFSAHRLDPGTAVLLRTVAGLDHELPASGTLADVGCGWGPIALTMALLAPGCRVWAVDVNPRALALTEINARRLGLANLRVATPEQAADVAADVVWSNPPIRVGKSELHDLLADWLGRLTPGGRADLVIQRNLGADSLQRWLTEQLGAQTTRLASAKGYRVLRAQPPSGSVAQIGRHPTPN